MEHQFAIPRLRHYVQGWIVLLALPGFLWYAVTLGPLRAAAFNAVTSERSYLANLREPELACRSLSLRRPRVVVIGDSHSYAGWNFSQLQRTLERRVGACAIGGLYADSLPALIDFVAEAADDAKLLVLGLSPRMFWDSPTKQAQMEHHSALIASLTPNARPFFRRAVLGEPLPYDGEYGSIARHAKLIESLDENAISDRLSESRDTILSLRDWAKRLEDVRTTSVADKVVPAICDAVRRSGARLWVVHVPESPYLESRYSPEVWHAYRSAIDALSPCAERILVAPARALDLGNRHYVNRALDDAHDYAAWRRPGAIHDEKAFDADHLNPVGAERFTREALSRLTAP